MQLYYYKDPNGNFGDDLNPWLWSRLLPGFFDDDRGSLFVGIGTLLNHRLPPGPVKHVFGSGFGYGDPPSIDGRYVFHAVRGPDTARALNIDPRLAITDAAILLRTVSCPRAESVSYRFGFIPHSQSSRYFEWERVCDELGFKYISAQWDVETVLFEMSKCGTLLCEAMHGAIAADTLRIPWIPVSCYDFISAFKWKDWLSTMNLPYAPHTITSLYDIERGFAPRARMKNQVKRGLRRLGIWSPEWTPPPPPATGPGEFGRAVAELAEAAKGPAYLSEERLLDTHVARYVDLLRKLPRQR